MVEKVNPKKKYTMQDIADAVGVSKATVSYVLNGKENSRVSDETRDKILHVANLYNYVPNFAARYLSSNVSNFIGLICGETDSPFYRADFMEFMDALAGKIETAGDKLIYIHRDDEALKTKLSYPYAVLIAVNVCAKDIEKISKATFSPLLLVDSLTEDPLFFQVVTDYAAGAQDQNGVILQTPVRNGLYGKLIRDRLPGREFVECKTFDCVREALRVHKGRPVTVMGKSLGEAAMAMAGPECTMQVQVDDLDKKISVILKKIEELRQPGMISGGVAHVTEIKSIRS